MFLRRTIFFLAICTVAAAEEPGPIMQSILPRYETAKLNLIETAALMPEADYSYKLTPPQRSFGGWIEHNIGMNYNLCSSAMGKTAPSMKKYQATAKAELEQGLKESFAYCDELFKNMTDQKSLQPVESGGKKVYPVNVMIGLVVNWNEHYGNLVGYMRSKNLVPPSTARAQKQKGH
jgi:hypothetical protein